MLEVRSLEWQILEQVFYIYQFEKTKINEKEVLVGVDGRTLLDRHNCLTDPIRALYRERTKKERYWTENEPRKWTVLNLDETVTDDFAQ